MKSALLDPSEQFGKKHDVIHVCCMAHAHRKFAEAQANDAERGNHALAKAQELYALERLADQRRIFF